MRQEWLRAGDGTPRMRFHAAAETEVFSRNPRRLSLSGGAPLNVCCWFLPSALRGHFTNAGVPRKQNSPGVCTTRGCRR
jgi:hypothetical protein